MAQFNYTLPSGASFTMDAPAGTTQTQADYIFYSQVAAGALVGFKPGQKVTSTSSAVTKFVLSRLDRGTAGVDDSIILAIVNGTPTLNTTTTSNVNTVVNTIPSLVNTPLINPVTQANILTITGTGFTAPSIGPLSSSQVLALMAQVSNIVDQPADTATDDTGVGQYGLNSQQLEMVGYVKPGTWEQFIKNGPSTTTEVLGVSGVWTGLHGIYSMDDFLKSNTAQNFAQSTLMQNGYSSLQAAGVITTPAAQSISAAVATVYTGSNAAVALASASVTDQVNGQVASLVTNASQYGTSLTAQWAGALPPVTNLTSNLTDVTGQLGITPSISSLGSLTSGITPDLSTVNTAMNVLGKASQFASTAAGALAGGLSGLSTSSLSGLSSSLSNLSVGGITNQLSASASALAGQLQGQIAGQASALVGQLQGQANALIAQAQSQLNSLLSMGDSLVASVQKAAGFANTVNRATVDTAFSKILGSGKISLPSFGTPDSASVGAALDISKAQSVLSGMQNQATALVSQVQSQASGIASQASGIASQAQNAVGSVPVFSSSQVNQLLG